MHQTIFINYTKSNNNMANIHLLLDKRYYFRGETILGRVNVFVHQPVKLRQIAICFKGIQDTQWIDVQRQYIQQPPHNNKSSKSKQKHFYTKKPYFRKKPNKKQLLYINLETQSSQDQRINQIQNLYTVQKSETQIIRNFRRKSHKVFGQFATILHNFGEQQVVKKGLYVFPFSFMIDETYPASYTGKSEKDQYKGRIKYKLKAQLKNLDTKISSLIQLIIRQRKSPTDFNSKMTAGGHLYECCNDMGFCKISCKFDQNQYKVGDIAEFQYKINNTRSRVGIERLSIKLINIVTLNTTDHHSKKIRKQIFCIQYSGVKAGQFVQNYVYVSIKNLNNNQDMYYMPPTSLGQLIQSQYFIQVTAEADVKCNCCGSNPTLKYLVTILPREQQDMNVQYDFNKFNQFTQSYPMKNIQRIINKSNLLIDKMANTYETDHFHKSK